MTIDKPEILGSFEHQPSDYEHTAEAVAEAYQLMCDYQVEDLLRPLADYYPDAAEPLQALLSISHIYGWPVEEVASVIVDVANSNDPIMTSEKHFKPYTNESGLTLDSFRGQVDGGAATFRFGADETVIDVLDRPLPDGWDQGERHSEEQWRHRAEVAEDITIYFSDGARRLLDRQSPVKLFEAAPAIQPYFDYVSDCTMIADLMQTKEVYFAWQQARVGSLRRILRQPIDMTELVAVDSPVNEDTLQAGKKSVNRLILQAWRNHSSHHFTPEQLEHLEIESVEAVREIKMLAQIAVGHVLDDLGPSLYYLTHGRQSIPAVRSVSRPR